MPLDYERTLEGPDFAMNPVLKKFKVPESNLFLMTRFTETSYHDEISRAVADGASAFGLEFIRADDPNWSVPTLWERLQYCLEACHYGVAVFETIDTSEFNPNIFLELGYLMALKRNCLLLKEKRLRGLPSDLGGHMYQQFDSRNIRATVLGEVAGWLKQTGVRKRDGDRLIVFVSKGGTCRCALAKAVTKSLFHSSKEWGDIRVESRAAGSPSLPTATAAAIKVARSKLKQDWLSEHRPRRVGAAFLYEADLILATDSRVLKRLRNTYINYPGTDDEKASVQAEITSKSHLVSEFFGSSGDIEDPWPDNGDEASLNKYKNCLEQLHTLISNGFEALTNYLEREKPSNERGVAFGETHLSR